MTSLIAGLALTGLIFGGTFKGCSSDPLASSPKFKVGDCIALGTEREHWEEPSKYVEEIMEIGKRKYRTRYVLPQQLFNTPESVYISSDDIYRKVECPK